MYKAFLIGGLQMVSEFAEFRWYHPHSIEFVIRSSFTAGCEPGGERPGFI